MADRFTGKRLRREEPRLEERLRHIENWLQELAAPGDDPLQQERVAVSEGDVLNIVSAGTDSGWTSTSSSGTTSTGSRVSLTAAYTAGVDDRQLLCNAAGGAFTVTLPPANSWGATEPVTLSAVKTDTSLNAVTLDGAGSDTINGAATLVLGSPYDGVVLIPDGASNWSIV